MKQAIQSFGYYLSTALLLMLGLVGLSQASEEQINKVLAMEEAPEGIVFEVISGKKDYLKTALDTFEIYQKQLKEKFPDIELAIVSHGSEQFSLTKQNQEIFKDTHQQVQRITDAEIPVHICETHASWYDITAEDFPDYVSVSSQGPAQIRDYQELGYLLIVL